MGSYGRREWDERGKEKEENNTIGQQIKINSSQCWGDERSSKYIPLPLTSFLPNIGQRGVTLLGKRDAEVTLR